MIINNGVENGKVYGKELEVSNTIENTKRIEINKTEEKEDESIKNETERELVNVNDSQEKVKETPLKKQEEDENQEDESQEDKKTNIIYITLAIVCSIVLIVILALIISTIKNKSKNPEGTEEAVVGKSKGGGQAEAEEEDEEKHQLELINELNNSLIDQSSIEQLSIAQLTMEIEKTKKVQESLEKLLAKATKKKDEAEKTQKTIMNDIEKKELNDEIQNLILIEITKIESADKIITKATEIRDLAKEIEKKLQNKKQSKEIAIQEEEERKRKEAEERQRKEAEALEIQRQQEEAVKKVLAEKEQIKILLKEIFDTDVNKKNATGSINLKKQYNISIDPEKQKITNINLLNNKDQIIMHINNNCIQFYSNSNNKLYKSINLQTLKISSHRGLNKQQNDKEITKQLIEELTSNNHDIKNQIISLLTKSTELVQDEINQESLINFLKHIKEDVINNLKQQEEIQNLLNAIFDIDVNKINKTGSINLTEQYKISIDPETQKIKNIYLMNGQDKKIIMAISIDCIDFYSKSRFSSFGLLYKSIDLKTLQITCQQIYKDQEKEFDEKIKKQLEENHHDTEIMKQIISLLQESRQLGQDEIEINQEYLMNFLKNIKEDFEKKIDMYLEPQK